MTPLSQIPKKGPVVAIDGPAGTGKSSATKQLADLLGFVHIDTGALYRAIAYEALTRSQIENDQAIVELARKTKLEFRRMPEKNPANRVFSDGEDVTTKIRTPEVSLLASRVSAIPGVRSALLELQRRLGCEGKAILEGRDIGTVVFPDADVKFFLNASLEERAKRRLAQLEGEGADVPSFHELKQQIAMRDEADRNRAVAPLKKANDAIELDTTNITLDDAVTRMAEEIRKRLKKSP